MLDQVGGRSLVGQNRGAPWQAVVSAVAQGGASDHMRVLQPTLVAGPRAARREAHLGVTKSSAVQRVRHAMAL